MKPWTKEPNEIRSQRKGSGCGPGESSSLPSPRASLRVQRSHQALGPAFSLPSCLAPAVRLFQLRALSHKGFHLFICLFVWYLNHFLSSPHIPPGPKGPNQIKPVLSSVPQASIGFRSCKARDPLTSLPPRTRAASMHRRWAEGLGGGLGRFHPGPFHTHCPP